jgi:hypothetical protein
LNFYVNMWVVLDWISCFKSVADLKGLPAL